MTEPGWDRIAELFEAARRLAPIEREAFLRAECGDDEELEAQVLRMLEDEAPSGFLRNPLEKDAGDELSGQRLGDFLLLREIGRGGMGVVYVARQEELHRQVAVKVLPWLHRADDKARKRFRLEARAASQLDHPHAVAVLASGETEDHVWYAMRFVDGHDLNHEITLQRKGETDLLPGFGSAAYVAAVVKGIADLADALQAAHTLGIVHRDVKPHNVLIDATSAMYLADFGLARDDRLGTISTSSVIKGTPHYMSPEQARAVAAKVDHRTDVYSLSVVLYELLSLRRPFEGKTTAEILSRISANLPHPLRRVNPNVALDLATICEKGMFRNPSERYATAADMADDLRRFLRREAISARPPGLKQRAERLVRKHGTSIALASLLLLGSGVGGGLAWRVARARTLEERREPLRALAREADWNAVPIEQLIEAFTILADLDEESSWSDELRDRFEQLRDAWVREGTALVDMGRESNDDHLVVLGLERLQRASVLFPHDEELLSLASSDVFGARLTIQSDEAVEVSCATIDPMTTMPSEWSATDWPVESLSLPPGYYRVRVSTGGDDFEFTRWLQRGGVTTIKLSELQGATFSSGGMVLVPGTRLHLSDGARSLSPLNEHSVEIPSFWIDRAEVTNEEYGRFLDATGHAAPRFWDQIRSNELYAEYPVVDVSWEDARRYAEWAGKRLPTLAEWMLAMRTENGRHYPWTDEVALAPESYRGATAGPNLDRPTRAEDFADYLAHASPVLSHPDAATALGIHGGLGNVEEWTESCLVETSDGSSLTNRTRRYVAGSWWAAAELAHTLLPIAHSGTGPNYRSHRRGFRCARSWTR